MTKQLISIIVPIYKAEKYIDKCIKSILSQTYSNLEIILIDDGSPDQSGKICDEFAITDKRIKVIHTENKGVSNARNKGIELMTGKWVIFIDSDDFISSSLISDYAITLEAVNTQSIIFQGYNIFSNEKIKKIEIENKKFEKLHFDKALKYLHIDHDILGYTWSKIFNASIIKNNNIIFNTSVSLAEDLIFTLEYIKHCNTIYTIAKNNYFYNIDNTNGLSRKKYDYTTINNVIEITNKLFTEILKNSETQSYFDKKILDSKFCSILSLFEQINSKYSIKFRIREITKFKDNNKKNILTYNNNFYFILLKTIMIFPPCLSNVILTILLKLQKSIKSFKSKLYSL